MKTIVQGELFTKPKATCPCCGRRMGKAVDWSKRREDLLGWVETMLPPYSRIGTSEAAAAMIANVAPQLRKQVLSYIWARGDKGATDEEIGEKLDMPLNTARARRWELSDKLDVIYDSGVRRHTSSGAEATVWRVRKEL